MWGDGSLSSEQAVPHLVLWHSLGLGCAVRPRDTEDVY